MAVPPTETEERGSPTRRPAFARSRHLFLRLLGAVYLLAFASLWGQLEGLVGTRGLLPVAGYLERAGDFYGPSAPWLLPSVFWLWPSDTALAVVCGTGVVGGALVVAGLAPAATLAALWALYLSLTVAGQTFLSFQWDVLLLETGLLAVLYAPWGWRPGPGAGPPPAAVRWVLWGLLFKLMWLSGITKLVSGDATWWNLTALTVHYETQPLPTWTSWFAHHLPVGLHQTSTAIMFAIELAVPFAIFAPTTWRRTRAVACGALVALQIGIGATGNYGFFNLLTVVLCLALLDDDHLAWRPWGPRPWRTVPTRSDPWVWTVTASGLAVVIGGLSLLTLWHEATYTTRPPDWSLQVRRWIQPLRSVNGYGLFRTMTVDRPEIVLEVTADGVTWVEHPFRWKPSSLSARPRFVQPHMPRLDWMLWFAALDPPSHRHWLVPLAESVRAGTPDILRLLGPSPLDGPPAGIRFVLYDYRFTSPEERRRTGHWWRRELTAHLGGVP